MSAMIVLLLAILKDLERARLLRRGCVYDREKGRRCLGFDLRFSLLRGRCRCRTRAWCRRRRLGFSILFEGGRLVRQLVTGGLNLADQTAHTLELVQPTVSGAG